MTLYFTVLQEIALLSTKSLLVPHAAVGWQRQNFTGQKCIPSSKGQASKQAGEPLIATVLSKSSVVDAAAIRFI